MSTAFNFKLATEIEYGIGVSGRIGSITAERGAKKVFIICDRGVRIAGLLEPIQQSINEAGIETEVFDEIEQSSSIKAVDKGADIVRAKGYDTIVAIGGGSALDSGKAVGVVASGGGACRDYAGSNKVKVPPVPVIAMPTTAGTSADLTDVAVIADREKHARLGLRSPLIVPAMAVVDPLLTASMPAHVTASTGMDALSHAIESYTNTVSGELTDSLSLQAIKLIGDNLRSAAANGDNIEARERMTMACVLIGMTYRNTRLGVLHAITGPFCGYYDIPHGVANAILLPHVMRFNALGNLEKFVRITEALGVQKKGMSRRDAAFRSADLVQEFLGDLGLPESFRDMKLDTSLLPRIASEALKSGNISVNPRKVTDEDILSICEKALGE